MCKFHAKYMRVGSCYTLHEVVHVYIQYLATLVKNLTSLSVTGPAVMVPIPYVPVKPRYTRPMMPKLR